MQSTSQSCGRIAWWFRQTATSFAESPLLITTVRISATSNATCSCSYTTGSTADTALRASPIIGRYISSSTPCSQNKISPEDSNAWSGLTQHERKQELKPDKNRNHFKRMWKKDLQIRQAHQARKRQQATVDTARLQNLRDKWHGGAALWHGSADQDSSSK